MLEAPDTPAPETSARTSPADDSVLVSRDFVERMQAEIKFGQTKIEALNFEIARLKRWRFGSSAESLDSSAQAVLFDAILMDTAAEDAAAKAAPAQPPAAPRSKGKAVRQALPAGLPRVDRHHDLGATHCACGQAFTRIGEEVSEQLDCVPAQFFVLRHIRGKYACACCQTVGWTDGTPRNISALRRRRWPNGIGLGLAPPACWSVADGSTSSLTFALSRRSGHAE